MIFHLFYDPIPISNSHGFRVHFLFFRSQLHLFAVVLSWRGFSSVLEDFGCLNAESEVLLIPLLTLICFHCFLNILFLLSHDKVSLSFQNYCEFFYHYAFHFRIYDLFSFEFVAILIWFIRFILEEPPYLIWAVETIYSERMNCIMAGHL